MTTMILLAVFCVAFGLAPSATAAAQFTLAVDMADGHSSEDVAKAADLYRNRNGTGENARTSLGILEKYLAEHPDDFVANVLAAEDAFWVCDRTEDENVKKEMGQVGMKYSKKAIELQPEHVAGYYFYTITLGEYSKGISIVTALFQGLDKDYRIHVEKALALDPAFEAGGPGRAYGRFYFKLPWPKYNAKRSIEHLKKSLEFGPNKVRTYFYMAETLIKEKKWDLASEQIDKGLLVPTYDWDRWEDVHYREKLKELKALVEKKRTK